MPSRPNVQSTSLLPLQVVVIVGLLALLLTSLSAHWAIWAAGIGVAAVLVGLAFGPPATRLASSVSDALAERAVPPVLVVLAALGLLLIAVFGVTGAVFGGLVYLAVAGCVAWLGGGAALRGLLVATAMSGVTLSLTLGAAEWIFRRPGIQLRYGLPIERASWFSLVAQIQQAHPLRFRSPYEDVRVPPGTLRVAAIGDSFTFGEAIEATAHVWPSRLESVLDGVTDGLEIEVVNMARPGFSAPNIAERMRRVGWQFDPGVVVVQFLANDPLPSTPNGGLEPGRRDELYPRHRLLPVRFRDGAIANSSLFAFIEGQYSQFRAGPMIPRYEALFEDDEPGWIQTQEAFREIATTGRERGVPVLLMLFPLFPPGEWTAESYPLADVNAKVLAAAEAAGLETFDLTPVFAAEGGDWRDFWALPYDAHPSIEAHDLVARALADHFASAEWYREAEAGARYRARAASGL